MIYYRRYLGAYTKNTTNLSMRDHGAYTLMLDFYYTKEHPLPPDVDEIYDICKVRTTDDRKSADKVLRLFFQRQSDGYHNERADEEIAASKQARTNGGKGGRPPRNKTGKQTGGETEEETEPGTEVKTERVTGGPTETGGGSGHPSSFNHLAVQPSPVQPSPDTRQPTPLAPDASRRTPRRRAKGEAKTASVWEAYREAYLERWGADPVRNAAVNGKLARYIERIPADEAPAVAAFYVRSNRSLYVSAKHAVDLLLRDCESLRTEWATGRQGTGTEALQADRTQATGNAFTNLIREAEERERHAGE